MKFTVAVCLLAPVMAHASCFDDAAAQYRVEPALLKAIAWQESHGHPNAVGPQLRDGNVALGAMQINTNHLSELAPYGVERKDLFNGCTSVNLGAWILSRCIRDVGRTWNAVACYYAGPKSRATAAKVKYVRSVQKYYRAYKAQESKHREMSREGQWIANAYSTGNAIVQTGTPGREMTTWGNDE